MWILPTRLVFFLQDSVISEYLFQISFSLPQLFGNYGYKLLEAEDVASSTQGFLVKNHNTFLVCVAYDVIPNKW